MNPTILLSRADQSWQKISTPLMRAQKATTEADYRRYLQEAKGYAEELLRDLEALVAPVSP